MAFSFMHEETQKEIQMAVNEGGNKNGAGGPAMGDAFARAGVGARAEPQPQAAQASQSEQRRASGVGSLSQRLRPMMNRSSAGEVVTKYMNALKEIINDDPTLNQTDIRLLLLDNAVRHTGLSAIVITVADGEGPNAVVAAHALIIEGSAGKLNDQPYVITIKTVSGDVFNNAFYDQIANVVNDSYGQNVKIADGNGQVVYSEVESTDKAHLRTILYYATQALMTALDNASNTQNETFSVSWISRTDQPTVRIDHHPLEVESATGLPVRADISIMLSSVIKNAGDPLHTPTQELARTDGYIDLNYTPPQPPAWGQAPDTRHYTPRFIMTRLVPMTDAITLELFLLAITNSAVLAQNMAWAPTFMPRYGTGPNTRDIGAIGLEMPMLTASGKPEKILTQPTSFTPDDLYMLITKAIRPELVFSLDVEECGEMSFMHLAIAAAAQGNQDALNLIVSAANNLTDGNFSRYWQPGPIARDSLNRIHLGYYLDQNSVRKDIRDIDLLAMYNLVGEQDLPLCIRFANTYDQTSVPMEVRLEERYKILSSVAGETMRIKGMAQRIDFMPSFITALVESTQAAGLVIAPHNIKTLTSGAMARGNAGLAGMGFAGNTGNLFNHMQQNNGGVRGMAGIQGRWGR
jgi:hypothetical protein